MNSNIKIVGKREDGTLILGVGDLDLTFDPKLGNECNTCGYKEWKR